MATERLRAARRREGRAAPMLRGPRGNRPGIRLQAGRGRWGRASWKEGFSLWGVQMGAEGRARGQVLITGIVAKRQKCLGFHYLFSCLTSKHSPISLQTHCTDEDAEAQRD